MNIERPTNSNGLAVGLIILNGFGALAAFAIAAVLVLTVLSEGTRGTRAVQLALPMISLAWVSGLVGLILAVGLSQAIARLRSSPVPAAINRNGLVAPSIALVTLWPAALLGGNALAVDPGPLSLLLLPPCLILAVAVPTWWLLAFARRGLSAPAHRMWGTASVVVMVALPLAMLVELFFILVGGMVLFGLISNQPELVNNLNALTRALTSGDLDADRLVALFEPFMRNRSVVFLLLSGLAVVVPLVEEILKPLGLWFLARRGFSPQQGFILGATSGAAFALVESLTTLSSISGEGWLGLALGRAGTSLLHITCSSLVGWGLGLAWTQAKYVKLAGLFLAAVAIHGAWNGFAQFLGLLPYTSQPALPAQSTPLGEIGIITILAVILVSAMIILYRVNRRLNLEQAQAIAADLNALAAAPATPFSPPFANPVETEPIEPPQQSS